jgi:hypothetical protein
MSQLVHCTVCPEEDGVYLPLGAVVEHMRTQHPDYHPPKGAGFIPKEVKP